MVVDACDQNQGWYDGFRMWIESNYTRAPFGSQRYQLLPISGEAREASESMKHTSPTWRILAAIMALLIFIGTVSAAAISRRGYSNGFPLLLDSSIEAVVAGLESNHFTSVDLVNAYLARIVEVNDALNAVTEVNPDAVAIAARFDAERSAGHVRGPLHGVPIIVKNNIATFDHMNTTAGSWALLGSRPPKDSTVVAKLRAAGAILLAKANLSQWANFRSSNSSNGWASQGGQVYGPYFAHQDPRGSSSGSAVVAAIGLASATLGTETDGSIIFPASHNNVVGIKPTVGLTSRHLVIPISEHQDTVGPIARTVKDAAYVLQAIAGADPNDNYTSTIPKGDLPDYVAACDSSALAGKRVGIPTNVLALHNDTVSQSYLQAFNLAVQELRNLGAVIVENADFKDAVEYYNSELGTIIIEADFIVNLHDYLALLVKNPNNITTLAELRQFTQSFPAEDYPDRNTATWDDALEGFNNTDPRFWPAYQHNLYFGEEGGLLGAIKRHNLDAIIMPSEFAPDWAAGVGAPVITIPMGAYPPSAPVKTTSRGLVESAPNIPFGIAFMGEKFSEAKLIGMAYSYEQRTQFRTKVRPYVEPRTELKDIIGR